MAQIAGGILAGSLALIADALHNFYGMASLVIAFAARKIARRPAGRTLDQAGEFNITHSTLQFEREDQANQNASLYGHGANRKEEENVQGDDGRG